MNHLSPPPSIFGKLNRQNGKDRFRSFTLVEMLIVIVIIGILAAALVPKLIGIRERAIDVGIEKSVSQMQQALLLYQQDHGIYPGQNTPVEDCSPYVENPDCYHYARTCRDRDGTVDPGAEQITKDRREKLMQTLKPYLQSDFSITERPWPYCIYYMTPGYGGCGKFAGYSLIFATKQTTFSTYQEYRWHAAGTAKARYCAYPIE